MQGLQITLTLFLVMACGWLLRRSGKIDHSGEAGLNTVLYWILMPLGIMEAGLKLKPEQITDVRFPLVLYSAFTVCMVIAWFIARMRKLPPKRASVSVLTSVRSNVIYLGMPVATLFLGEVGLEALTLYITIGMLYYNFVPVIAAQVILDNGQQGHPVRSAMASIVKNPLIIGGVCGILLTLTGVTPHIPGWVRDGISILSVAGSGLALLVIGMALNFGSLWGQIKESFVDQLVKLLVMPVVTIAAFLAFPIDNVPLMQITVLIAALSPAFNCYIIAREMGMDAQYTNAFVTSSTIVAMFLMPLWIEVCKWLF